MSDYVSPAELERQLFEHDREIRDHYDDVFMSAMTAIAETEKAMGLRLSKNIKWLAGTLLTAIIAYATISVTLNLSARADQTKTDTEQTQQILDAWRAIERSAAIVSEHSASSKREFDQAGDNLKNMRSEMTERIRQLETEQRDHERAKEH